MSVTDLEHGAGVDTKSCALCHRAERISCGFPRHCNDVRISSQWSDRTSVKEALTSQIEGHAVIEAAWAALIAWFNDWPEAVSFSTIDGRGRTKRTFSIYPELDICAWLRRSGDDQLNSASLEEIAIEPSLPTLGDSVLVIDCDAKKRMWVLPSAKLVQITREGIEIIGRQDSGNEKFVESLRSKLEQLIVGIQLRQGSCLLDIATLQPDEIQEIIQVGVSHQPENEQTFTELLLSCTRANPDATALLDSFGEISYSQLIDRAETIGRGLASCGIRPGDRVGIMLPRSSNLVLCMIACQMLGASFIVMDSNIPDGRRYEIAVTVAPKIVIFRESDRKHWPMSCTRIATVALLTDLAVQASDEFNPVRRSEELEAYVIFTSGTSGRPKAVSISNRALWSFCHAARDYLRIDDTDKVLQFALPTFDAVIEEVFPTLIEGACLIIRDEMVVGNAKAFFDWIRNAGVTVLNLPTGYWREMISAALSLGADLPMCVRLVVIGGEALQDEDVRHWRKLAPRDVMLLNTYGPTEATVVSSVWPLPRSRGDLEPMSNAIGKPIGGRSIFIVDRFGRASPQGAGGEIYIGGTGLATSYVGDQAATAQRFVTWAGLPISENRFYKTGDRGRMNGSWDCEFLGRVDSQVKWRGFRVELSEIATAMRRLPAISDAAVLPLYEGRELKQLVGFVVAAGESHVTPAAVRAHLEKILPRYMLPSRLYCLGTLPLTAAGKTDMKSLEAYAVQQVVTARATDHGKRGQLAQIWRESLGLDSVTEETDFFLSGGDSLASVGMMAEIAAEFGVGLPANQLYITPTFGSFASAVLANHIDGAPDADSRSHVPSFVGAEFTIWREQEAKLLTDISSDFPGARTLITGVSGFLGSMILEDLLAADDKSTVVCLVREDSIPKFERRIAKLELKIPNLRDRLNIVAGDMGAPGLGLNPIEWWQLASSIDQIFNCAANTNMLLSYQALRAPNVDGVRELLRLTNTGKRKRLNHISTLAVLGESNHKKLAAESIGIQEIGNLTSGYAQSKWVAEKLISNAREKGADCKIFRCGRIWGGGGIISPNPNDFILSVLSACVLLGIYPDIEFELDVASVDYVSEAIRHLSALDDPSYIYHINNPAPISFKAVCEGLIAENGALRPVPYADWRFEVLRRIKDVVEHNRDTPLKNIASIAPALSSSSHLDWADHYIESTRTSAILGKLTFRCPDLNALNVQSNIDRLVRGSSP
jgi:nonribosomal peptide synthetase MxcG